MNENATGEGYWYTPYGKEREWREAPRCADCGTVHPPSTPVRDKDTAADHEVIAEAVCTGCGKLLFQILKPSQADIARGRELAEKYGW